MYDGTLFPYGKNFPQPPLRLRAAQARRGDRSGSSRNAGTLARNAAAHARTRVCAHQAVSSLEGKIPRVCWVRRVAGRRARGRDQGPARTTKANRKHRHATKHAV